MKTRHLLLILVGVGLVGLTGGLLSGLLCLLVCAVCFGWVGSGVTLRWQPVLRSVGIALAVWGVLFAAALFATRNDPPAEGYAAVGTLFPLVLPLVLALAVTVGVVWGARRSDAPEISAPPREAGPRHDSARGR